MSLDGEKDLEKKLREMARLKVKKEVAQAIQTVRAAAVARVHVITGELRRSIFAEIEEQGDSTIGTCYTNKEYAVYVEMGTGPVGQEHHEGISPKEQPVYVQHPWWIHESQVDKETAERYHWFFIDTPEGRFYQCRGQAAHPFLYPALKDNQETILKDFKSELLFHLEEKIKK